MASFESEAARIIDNFNGEKFNLWKFKIGSGEPLPSNVDPKVLMGY
jgi:hypothetical protein